MKPDESVSQSALALARFDGLVAVPGLNYAPVTMRRSVRRWLGSHPGLLVTLAVGAAMAFSWYGWKWRLKEDEKAFNAEATVGQCFGSGWATFVHPPTTASLRHLSRLPNICEIYFDWHDSENAAEARVLRGFRLTNVSELLKRRPKLEVYHFDPPKVTSAAKNSER